MFWADKIAEEIKNEYRDKIAKNEAIIIRDEKTASGKIHVGSLRGVAIHGIISEVLNEQNIKNKFLYEINDFDVMDGLPVYLDRETFLPHMGKPLCNVPSPDGKAKNYAEYFGQEFIKIIESLGFKPEFYRSSDLYKTGEFNEAIKTALENADKIREIYKKISGADKEKGWLPISMVCQNCGKIGTTKAISFDGKEVEYICEENYVEWAKGCGYRGKISPFDGNAKLPWKVEWAAKFSVLDVSVEGAGKDHSTKGGAREVADTISREVFKRKPPFDIKYEFFQVGGKKMSSSKGAGSSAKEIADSLPPEIFRFLLLYKEPRQVIDFIPDGDTIPILYDNYDKMAEDYFTDRKGDYKRIFYLSHTPQQRAEIIKRFLPRFSQIAFLAQMPHINISQEVEKIKAEKLSDEDESEVEYRIRYALKWLSVYAPEDYKFELQTKEIPLKAKELGEKQKQALKIILDYVSSKDVLDGQELHSKLHEIKSDLKIEPKELFSAIYLSFLGKVSGPKVGWFLSVLDKKFLEKRLNEVVSS
ncbi:MAG: lysine--tRNA ligase [Patescibacteria group bacterium]